MHKYKCEIIQVLKLFLTIKYMQIIQKQVTLLMLGFCNIVIVRHWDDVTFCI